MQVVVADTGPLNYLILIDLVALLPKLFGKIIIPAMVYDEIKDNSRACRGPGLERKHSIVA